MISEKEHYEHENQGLGVCFWTELGALMVRIPCLGRIPKKESAVTKFMRDHYEGSELFSFGKLCQGGGRAAQCPTPKDLSHACWRPQTYGGHISILNGHNANNDPHQNPGSFSGASYHAIIRGGELIIDMADEAFVRFYQILLQSRSFSMPDPSPPPAPDTV